MLQEGTGEVSDHLKNSPREQALPEQRLTPHDALSSYLQLLAIL